MALSKYAAGKTLRRINDIFVQDTKDAVKQAAAETMDLVKRKLYQYVRETVYAEPESDYYTPRTGEFGRSIEGRLNWSHGKYYITVYFNEDKWNAVHRDKPQFNSHADYYMHKIDDVLVDILNNKYEFWEKILQWMNKYANDMLYKKVNVILERKYKRR